MPHADPLLVHVAGGVGIGVTGDLPLDDTARLHAARGSAPHIMLRLTATAAAPPLRPTGTPAVETDSWVAFVDAETVRLCVKDNLCAPAEAMLVELGRVGLSGRCVYAHPFPYFLQYPIDQLLAIHALGVGGGALMHAAGIVGRDGAVVVAGPSGAGKTTMARACAALGAPVLSDERTVVLGGDGGWLAGGTPWPGDGGFTENRTVPLRAVVLIEQAERNELTPLPPARALARLFRCHFPPVWDATAVDRTLGHLERLLADVPAYVYRNRKGPEAARQLLGLVGGVA